MTAFDLSKFDMGYGSERYVTYEGKFVARFKYSRPTACARHFVKFLVQNFTVEEYFGGLTQPKIVNGKTIRTLAPAEVLETKGFIDFNTRSAMKREGCATREELLAKQLAAFDGRRAAA